MDILFITWTRIGDGVLSTGLLAHLAERHPQARITVACGPLPAPLFRPAPGVERVFELRKRPWAGHWRRLWRDCVGRRWDLVVDLRGSLVPFALRARKRCVSLRRPAGDLHKLEEVAALVGLEEPPLPRLWLTLEARAAAAALVPHGPVLAIGPTASWEGKRWPAERFAALAGRLTGPGGPLPDAAIAVFATAEEREQCQPLLAAVPPGQLIDLVGRVDLLTAAACLARCALFVGNDSGPMHMAAAVGTPTLGLFGPSRPEQYGPRGPHCAALRTPDAARLPDRAAFARSGRTTLMDGLAVEAVEAAAAGLWRRTRALA